MSDDRKANEPEAERGRREADAQRESDIIHACRGINSLADAVHNLKLRAFELEATLEEDGWKDAVFDRWMALLDNISTLEYELRQAKRYGNRVLGVKPAYGEPGWGEEPP